MLGMEVPRMFEAILPDTVLRKLLEAAKRQKRLRNIGALTLP